MSERAAHGNLAAAPHSRRSVTAPRSPPGTLEGSGVTRRSRHGAFQGPAIAARGLALAGLCKKLPSRRTAPALAKTPLPLPGAVAPACPRLQRELGGLPRCSVPGTARNFTACLETTVASVQSIPQTSRCNNSQEDEKCHKLFTHKRDEKGEEERLRSRDTRDKLKAEWERGARAGPLLGGSGAVIKAKRAALPRTGRPRRGCPAWGGRAGPTRSGSPTPTARKPDFARSCPADFLRDA